MAVRLTRNKRMDVVKAAVHDGDFEVLLLWMKRNQDFDLNVRYELSDRCQRHRRGSRGGSELQLTTLLITASCRGHLSIVRLLLDYEADVNLTCSRRATTISSKSVNGVNGVTALSMAVRFAHLRTAAVLLAAGAVICWPRELTAAACNHDVEMLELLLRQQQQQKVSDGCVTAITRLCRSSDFVDDKVITTLAQPLLLDDNLSSSNEDNKLLSTFKVAINAERFHIADLLLYLKQSQINEVVSDNSIVSSSDDISYTTPFCLGSMQVIETRAVTDQKIAVHVSFGSFDSVTVRGQRSLSRLQLSEVLLDLVVNDKLSKQQFSYLTSKGADIDYVNVSWPTPLSVRDLSGQISGSNSSSLRELVVGLDEIKSRSRLSSRVTQAPPLPTLTGYQQSSSKVSSSSSGSTTRQ